MINISSFVERSASIGTSAQVAQSNSLRSELSARSSGLSYVGQVTGFEQLLDAYSLVYKEYRKLGYVGYHACGIHFTPFQLSSSNQTLVALDESRKVVGTGSIVVHSEHGLPSGYLFEREFSKLMRQGRPIAEGSLLSCHPSGSLGAGDVSLRLICTALSYLATRGASHFCVVVNPKHVRFWHEKLGFELISEGRACSQVKGAPGHLLALDLDVFLEGSSRAAQFMQREFPGHWSQAGKSLSDYILEADEIAELMQLRADVRPLARDATVRSRLLHSRMHDAREEQCSYA